MAVAALHDVHARDACAVPVGARAAGGARSPSPGAGRVPRRPARAAVRIRAAGKREGAGRSGADRVRRRGRSRAAARHHGALAPRDPAGRDVRVARLRAQCGCRRVRRPPGRRRPGRSTGAGRCPARVARAACGDATDARRRARRRRGGRARGRGRGGVGHVQVPPGCDGAPQEQDRHRQPLPPARLEAAVRDWPAGDFRNGITGGKAFAFVLIAVVGVAGVVGAAWTLRRRLLGTRAPRRRRSWRSWACRRTASRRGSRRRRWR